LGEAWSRSKVPPMAFAKLKDAASKDAGGRTASNEVGR